MTGNEWPAIGSGIGGIAGIVIVLRVVRRPWLAFRSSVHKGKRITAALIGEDAITDPDTGLELRAAVPGIVERLGGIEDESRATRTAVERLADVHDEIASAQKTADHALTLAKKALMRIDEHHGVDPVHES